MTDEHDGAHDAAGGADADADADPGASGAGAHGGAEHASRDAEQATTDGRLVSDDSELRQAAESALRWRVSTGGYSEAKLGPGVHLVWDTDPSPYVAIDSDSPAHAGEPDRRMLADYGPHGDELAGRMDAVLTAVTDPHGPIETEYDEANSHDGCVLFAVYGVARFDD